MAEGKYLSYSSNPMYSDLEFPGFLENDFTRSFVWHLNLKMIFNSLFVASSGKDCDHKGKRDDLEFDLNEGVVQAGLHPGPVPHSAAPRNP